MKLGNVLMMQSNHSLDGQLYVEQIERPMIGGIHCNHMMGYRSRIDCRRRMSLQQQNF